MAAVATALWSEDCLSSAVKPTGPPDGSVPPDGRCQCRAALRRAGRRVSGVPLVRMVDSQWRRAFFSMIPVTLLLLRERLAAKRESEEHPLMGFVRLLRVVLRSRNLWICGGLLFMVQFSTEFKTPLFYYQTNVLKFTPQFIGNLMVAAGIMGLIGAMIYPFFLPKIPTARVAVHVDCLYGSHLSLLPGRCDDARLLESKLGGFRYTGFLAACRT